MIALMAIHAASTLMMTGLIWFVQLVHYPLMRLVGERRFIQYEREHMRRTTWIAAPLMIVEALSAAMLLYLADGAGLQTLAASGLIFLAMIWASTAALQVPCHRRLERQFNRNTAKRLVATNWIRTALWTARAMIAIAVPFSASPQI